MGNCVWRREYAECVESGLFPEFLVTLNFGTFLCILTLFKRSNLSINFYEGLNWGDLRGVIRGSDINESLFPSFIAEQS